MPQSVAESQYGQRDIEERFLAALRQAGLDLGALRPEDLEPFDELHAGGHEATVRVAEAAGLGAGDRVLDVGAGIGGPARLLAHRYGCRVTAVDLTEDFCRLSRTLTRLVGLEHRVEVVRGDALDLPVPDGSFDVVWTQHAAMNIADRPRLYAQMRRAVAPGGRLALHDVVAGAGGAPAFPLPWADEPSRSHLVTPDELRGLLTGAGFAVRSWTDATAQALAFFEESAARAAAAARPPGPHAFIPGLRDKLANLEAALRDGRLGVLEVVAEASAGG